MFGTPVPSPGDKTVLLLQQIDLVRRWMVDMTSRDVMTSHGAEKYSLTSAPQSSLAFNVL